MVETPLSPRRRPWGGYLLAIMAVAFLGVMARSGSIPETGQLVKFVPKGVLQTLPEHIQEVSLTTPEQQFHFVRSGPQAWRYRDTQEVVTDELRERLEGAIIAMHASAPIRLMLPEEYQGTGLQEFGLEPPRYSVTLADGQQVVLAAHFGAPNPQELLQYMRLQGSDAVYLMSRFLGQMWEYILGYEETQKAGVAR